jgi:hypothetical protein
MTVGERFDAVVIGSGFGAPSPQRRCRAIERGRGQSEYGLELILDGSARAR